MTFNNDATVHCNFPDVASLAQFDACVMKEKYTEGLTNTAA